MSISNVELRQKVFGARTADKKPLQRPACDSTIARESLPRGFLRFAALDAWTGKEAPLRPDPQALAARIIARAMASHIAEQPGRLVFADAGKGLAVLLVILAAITSYAGNMPSGFGWLTDIERFLHPFALPALMVFAGMFLRTSRNSDWAAYVARKLAPLALALVLWLMAAILVMAALSDAGTSSLLRLTRTASHHYMNLGIVLFVLPVFYLVWKMLSGFRTGTVFVLAAIVEILHTDTGGIFWVELMRGFVYFAAGHCFAQHFRRLARFTRDNPPAAAAILAVWASFNGLMISAALPLAYGEQISTLPFASLGLGLAGSAAMVMFGQIIGGSRFSWFFSITGRNWIAFYLALPVSIVFIAQAMTSAGLFVTSAHGIAAILSAVLAAGAVLILLELREPAQLPDTRAAR